VSAALAFDQRSLGRVEGLYMSPAMVARRREVLAALELRPGESVLDVGSGPGFLSREMAELVGPAGRVVGVDSSEAMVAAGRERCRSPWAEFHLADASALPLQSGSLDAVVGTQVYQYVRDTPKALAEIHRVLRRGGRLVIVDTDWDSIVWHSGNRDRMRRVLDAWSDHAADPHLPRLLGPMLAAAGFSGIRSESAVLLETAWNDSSASRGLIPMVREFVVGRRGLTADDAAAWAKDLERLGEAGQYFFSLNRYTFRASKAVSRNGNDAPGRAA
jgi:SAM-dependent methyltransferase